MNNTQSQAGGASDLLSSIMGVAVRNEEKIAAEDRAFCEERQTKLHATLRQLQWWYGLFVANVSSTEVRRSATGWRGLTEGDNAEPYRKSRNLAYEDNGSVDKYNCRNAHHSEDSEDYSAFEFMPFHSINEVVELYGKAVRAFANDIIRHFNRKYGVSVPGPDIDREKLPPGFMPTYQTYVDAVIEHLGGKGFRETAEDELIARFHKIVVGYGGKLKAELKGDRIVVSDMLYYEDYSWNTTLHLSWDYMERLNTLCAGILFGESGSLNGNYGFIAGYDRSDVDLTRRYEFVGGAISVKFFKNGRVDFRFGNAAVAERCWKRLRLDTLKTTDGDE